MPEARVIKKYANRRMYDTLSSKYITAEGVRKLVVEGIDVQIIDDTSGNDLTRTLLLQIIADQEQAGRPLLDSKMLMTIIRFYGHPMQEMMGAYLGTAANNFVNQQNTMQEQLQATLDPQQSAAFIKKATETNMEAWNTIQDALMRPFSAASQPKPTDTGDKNEKPSKK